MDQSLEYQYQSSSQPVPRSKKPLIFGICLLLLLLALASILAKAKSSAGTCISPADYQSFYGETPLDSHFDPKVSFFNKSYIFQPASSALDENESDSPSIDAAKLARFYSTHENKPMTFVITAAYDREASATTKPISEQRAAYLRSTLEKAGIPTAAISTEISSYASVDEESSDSADAASITLASAKTCQE